MHELGVTQHQAEPGRCSLAAAHCVVGGGSRLTYLASCKCLSVRSTFAFETFIMAGGWLVFDNAQALYLPEREQRARRPSKRSAGRRERSERLDL